MKHLIIVRHGQYGPGQQLNDRGRAQIEALADRLKSFMNGVKVMILTSTADRARESAEILGSAFGVGFEEHEILWSESSYPEDLPGTLKLVRSRKDNADVLVLVTHYEYVEKFPSYFARNELGTPMSSGLIEKGEAWVIDCFQKTLTHVRP